MPEKHARFDYKLPVILLLLAALSGCVFSRWSPEVYQPDELSEINPAGTLKVHLATGDVVVLTTWSEDVDAMVLRGMGSRYDARRDLVARGAFELPAETITLVETQVTDHKFLPGFTLFSIYATIMTAVTVQCVADPKACFGSCPTFYTDDADESWPVAEGFSRSVTRAMEERDIDALWHARPSGSRFDITMRNEALETHAVRHLRLLVAERPDNGRVLATNDGRFYPARNITPPSACYAAEGDCLEPVLAMDGRGRISLTDSTDLTVREVIELEFPAPSVADEPTGLVIAARHTFVSTHIFYQMLAWLGGDAASMLAMIESGSLPELPPLFDTIHDMGEIRVSVKDSNGAWQQAGIYNEAGPIATDIQVMPLGGVTPDEPLRIRLDLTRGFWRLDYLALAELGDPVEPVMLDPAAVYRPMPAVSADLPGSSAIPAISGDAMKAGTQHPTANVPEERVDPAGLSAIPEAGSKGIDLASPGRATVNMAGRMAPGLPEGYPAELHSPPDAAAHAMLLNPDRYLFTYPGDEYRIRFDLPELQQDVELFLDSRGYYYEWMRREWLDEQDPVKAFQLLYLPDIALRDLAVSFKKEEAGMEALFWESRIRRTNR